MLLPVPVGPVYLLDQFGLVVVDPEQFQRASGDGQRVPEVVADDAGELLQASFCRFSSVSHSTLRDIAGDELCGGPLAVALDGDELVLVVAPVTRVRRLDSCHTPAYWPVAALSVRPGCRVCYW